MSLRVKSLRLHSHRAWIRQSLNRSMVTLHKGKISQVLEGGIETQQTAVICVGKYTQNQQILTQSLIFSLKRRLRRKH